MQKPFMDEFVSMVQAEGTEFTSDEIRDAMHVIFVRGIEFALTTISGGIENVSTLVAGIELHYMQLEKVKAS